MGLWAAPPFVLSCCQASVHVGAALHQSAHWPLNCVPECCNARMLKPPDLRLRWCFASESKCYVLCTLNLWIPRYPTGPHRCWKKSQEKSGHPKGSPTFNSGRVGHEMKQRSFAHAEIRTQRYLSVLGRLFYKQAQHRNWSPCIRNFLPIDTTKANPTYYRNHIW